MALPSPLEEKGGLNLDPHSDNQEPKRESRRERKQREQKEKRSWPVRKIAKVVAMLLAIMLLAVGGYFAYKFIATTSKIFKGNPIAALFAQAKDLKQDADGQTNILLFGTSEDDPGHDAPDLTDSIMVASINQKQKTGFIVSIARDMYVSYDRTCIPGTKGKINVLYGCAKKKEGEEGGAVALGKKVGEILGLDIQYYTHVNYTVMREAVNAVGGITVTIESSDPRGILDSNFDWKCGNTAAKRKANCPTGHFIQYPNGPVNLDGEHALYLAQARGHGALTYGLSRSNPDRQDNQRKILLALKDKAASAGVLANPLAVNDLLDTMGNNLRTNFDAEEVKTLISLGKDVPSSAIASVSLEDPDHPLATVSCFSGNVCPNKGAFDYSDIHKTIHAYATSNTASLENATIDVLNASGISGLAQDKAVELSDKDYKVTKVGNAPESYQNGPTKIYDLSGNKKPATRKALEKLFGVTTSTGVPTGVNSNADFVVIIGKQADSN